MILSFLFACVPEEAAPTEITKLPNETEEVEDTLDDAPFYRLKEIAEELELELEEEFIGL